MKFDGKKALGLGISKGPGRDKSAPEKGWGRGRRRRESKKEPGTPEEGDGHALCTKCILKIGVALQFALKCLKLSMSRSFRKTGILSKNHGIQDGI